MESGKVCGIASQMKDCSICSLMRNSGKEVYPGCHENCTANLGLVDSLSEHTAARQIGETLGEAGIKVDVVTTDGDSKGYKGIEAGQKVHFPDHIVKRQACLTHLSKNLLNQAKKTDNYSSDMITKGKTTKAEKNKNIQQFASDLKQRATVAVYNLNDQFKKDPESVKSDKIVETLINCYNGNHKDCVAFSASTCQGTEEDNWPSKSDFLMGISMEMTPKDKEKVRDILNLMLSEAGLKKTEQLTTTNINEAFNRALSATLPKNVKFSTSFHGRLSMACLKFNHGPGTAHRIACETLKLPMSPAQKQFQNIQDKKRLYHQHYFKNKQFKIRRKKADQRVRNLYRERKTETKADTMEYSHNQLDPMQTSEKASPSTSTSKPSTSKWIITAISKKYIDYQACFIYKLFVINPPPPHTHTHFHSN